MHYDLVIAHRVCPSLAKTAIGFETKFDLVRGTTRSLASTLQVFGGTVKLVVIFDGCPPEYERFFRESFSVLGNVHLEILQMSGIGNQATYAKQVEVLMAVGDADFVYFSEDDYLYRPDAFKAMIDFLRRPGVDFVTPLDHPDRYNQALGRPKAARIRVSPYCHWRTVGTSCLTFMTSRKVLHEASQFLQTFGSGAMDGTMWLGITKEDVFNPLLVCLAILAFLFRCKAPFGVFMPLCAWKHHGLRILTTRRFTLWQPMPSLAVHLSDNSLPLHAEDLLSSTPESERATIRSKILSYMELR